MKLRKRKSAVFNAVGVCIFLVAGTLPAFGQQIPASSADSGRRAVIAVNQGLIYNNINNAQNAANNAWNYANVANNAAANAQAGADGAAGLAGEAYRRAGDAGRAYGTMATNFDLNGSDGRYRGICINGWAGAGVGTFANPCPEGSGPWVIYTIEQGANGGY